MRTPTVIATTLVLVGTVVGAQQPTFKRTVVQQADLSVPGREVVQALVEFQPGGTPGRHTHAGEEVGYVIDGTISVEQDGKPAVTLKGGQAFLIPAGHDPQRDEHRLGRRQDPRDLHRRKRQAARDAGTGEVTTRSGGSSATVTLADLTCQPRRLTEAARRASSS